MVRTHRIQIAEKFEPAKAIRSVVASLAWQRRLWAFVAVASFGAILLAVAVFAFAAIQISAHKLSPLTILWLLRFVVAFCLLSAISVFGLGFRRLLRESFSNVAGEIDRVLGREDVRNALDLAKLHDDEPFVSSQFARFAIYRAWQNLKEANQNGLTNLLVLPKRRKALANLAFALPLLVLSFWLTHKQKISVSSLLSLYRDAQIALAFERQGRLYLSVQDGDKVVLKGSVVSVKAYARCDPYPLPRKLSVWLECRFGEKTERMEMNREGENEFSATVEIHESTNLQAFSGKVKSNSVRIEAVPPPKIAEWLVTVEPPQYTNLQPETFIKERWQDLTVLKGSKVTIVATVTESLRDAHCLVGETQLTVDGRTIGWEGSVKEPISMKWRFVDKFGFEGETDWLAIGIQLDKPPKVALTAGMNPAMAGGFVPLTVIAEDDFGVSEISLQFGLGSEKQMPSNLQSAPLSIFPSPRVEQNLALPIPHDAAGKFLWLRAIAKDNDAVSGKKSASSQWLLVRIAEPENLVGTLQDWLERLRQWEGQLQKGDWQRTEQELSKWLQRWQEILQQAQWSETPITHHWLADWLAHWQEHLKQRDLQSALSELWRMQKAIERALAEQRLAELAQEISALRGQQEAIHDALRRQARPSTLTSKQSQLLERTKDLVKALKGEAERWEKLEEPTVAFALEDVAKILEQRPTERAMQQGQTAMEQDLREMALLRTHEALTDLREAEKRLNSPTQSPLAQLYRRERNLLAQLLEQTERLRRDQSNLRQETEKSLTSPRPQFSSPQNLNPKSPMPNAQVFNAPPPPPKWEEVEKLPSQQTFQATPQSFFGRQQSLRHRAEQMRRPLSEALKAIPQLSPDAQHQLQDAILQMSEAEKSLQLPNAQNAVEHQRKAESSLQQLAENLRKALMSEHGNATQRMGAGENEAMALAQRQAQLLRETQRLHQLQRQGQMPSPMRLRQMGAEEGSIRDALNRMEGFFGDALPPELRQRMQQSTQNLGWLEKNLPEGQIGEWAQQRQKQVLETLLELARILSGLQGNHQGKQQARQSQNPTQPDINWGRFVEHGPPMRQVPEALQGAKGGASFVEPSKGTSAPTAPIVVPRFPILPAYRDAIQKFQRQIR